MFSIFHSIPAVVLAIALSGLAICPDASADDDRPIQALVSVLPQQYLVERIGGEHVAVTVLVRQGQSHGVFDVTPRLMQAIERAEVHFRTGVAAENAFLRRMARALPNLRSVDTCQGLDLIVGEDVCVDDAHDDHDHSHAGEAFDPHVLMDRVRARGQAEIIAATPADLRPERTETFRRNLEALVAYLDALDAELRELLAPLRGRTMYVYHPAYGYFADRYGLVQESVELEGKDPGLRHVDAIAARMRQDGVKALFTQPQFAPASARAVARAAGVEIVELDPLAADYLDNLRRIGRRISAALAP